MSWWGRQDRTLVTAAQLLFLVFTVRVGANLGENLFFDSSLPRHSVWWVLAMTLLAVGMSRAPRRLFSGVLAVASLIVAATVGWVAWSVLSQGGFSGNHLATVTGAGSSVAMIFRGVAVAAVSFTVVDSVMVRWRGYVGIDTTVFRPAVIVITLTVSALAYVMVTAVGSLQSNIPYVFPAIADRYSGSTVFEFARVVPVVLLFTSAAVLWRGFELTSTTPTFRRTVVVAVVVGVLLPYPEMEVLQMAATLMLVSWIVVTTRALLRVSEGREPWYEWIPPTCGAAVSSLGLYGVIEQHLSLDQRSGTHHIIQLVLLLGAVGAVDLVTSRRERGGQRPGSVSLGNESELE
jgi:hypothetical protein